MRLTDFKALTFDCYGTLIDWEAGMMQALSGLVGKTTPGEPPTTSTTSSSIRRTPSPTGATAPLVSPHRMRTKRLRPAAAGAS